jgi:RNA polymerase sigma-70 factor (ECF subfamily)
MESRVVSVNGGPGVLMRVGGRPWCVITADVAGDGDRIQGIYIVLNPAKLPDRR